jgi:hypothetical protein
MASNNDYSFASGSKSSLNGDSLPTELFSTYSHLARIKEYLYCCLRIRFLGNVFTEPLPRNGFVTFAYLALLYSNDYKIIL